MTEILSFCYKVASLCIVCQFLIYCISPGTLISATAIGSLLNDVSFVLLYLCLLLIHDPFTKRSYFWIMWWTVLMEKLIKIIFKPNANYFLTWVYDLNRWHGIALAFILWLCKSSNNYAILYLENINSLWCLTFHTSLN